uniref:Uncharacterized protein n=1 Tax=Candidatus Nitrotoga fabula TaxID=2182327 RepID=A0A2X0SAI7_9PROT|nr:protein of unknown function [Candidatus Nitrotoga fabula]
MYLQLITFRAIRILHADSTNSGIQSRKTFYSNIPVTQALFFKNSFYTGLQPIQK